MKLRNEFLGLWGILSRLLGLQPTTHMQRDLALDIHVRFGISLHHRQVLSPYVFYCWQNLGSRALLT